MTARDRNRGRFRPGESGNPSGRPRGSRNRSTLLRDRLNEEDGENLIAVLRTKALNGDVDALKFLLSRILPPAKELPEAVTLNLPPDAPLSVIGAEVVQAALAGRITDTRAKELCAALRTVSTVQQIEELESRLAALEEKLGDA